MLEAHPPPAPGGRRLKLRYMTQVKARPPGFVIMTNHADQVPDSYQRYLVNGLRATFQMEGTPVRVYLRDNAEKNPYKGRRTPGPSRLRKHIDKG